MRTHAITLDPSAEKLAVSWYLYDGEDVQISVTRGGVTGDLVLTIAPLKRGTTPVPEPAIEVLISGSDTFLLPDSVTTPIPEGASWYWDIWNWDDAGHAIVKAEGTISKREAIRPDHVPTLTFDLTFGADALVFGADDLVFTNA